LRLRNGGRSGADDNRNQVAPRASVPRARFGLRAGVSDDLRQTTAWDDDEVYARGPGVERVRDSDVVHLGSVGDREVTL
jgi:hypothetical protein